MGQADTTTQLTERLKKGKKQKGGGSGKHGRNAAKCKHYRAVRSIPNKRRKLRRHIAKHPADGCAATAIQKVGNPAE